MQIRIEPKDWLMHSVILIFDEEAADAEDEAVREYLSERGLVPKHQSKTSWEGRDYEVMSFGGCYLGNHLRAITEIQEQAGVGDGVPTSSSPAV